MKQWARKQTGFTIVELLIVVVVIAILATITIVTYNGIQQRAQNTQTIQAVQQWAQALVSYASVHGDYPFTGDRNQTAPYSEDRDVIADNYPCLGQYADDTCASVNNINAFGAGWAVVNPEFNDIIKKHLGGTLPQPSQKIITINGQPHRGAFMNIVGYATRPESTGMGPSIGYFLAGRDTQCDKIGVGTMQPRLQGDNGVRCALTMPDFRK